MSEQTYVAVNEPCEHPWSIFMYTCEDKDCGYRDLPTYSGKIKLQWLKPDTRLQVIADAWNEYKASHDPDSGKLRYKLYDLLNALTEDDETCSHPTLDLPPIDGLCVECRTNTALTEEDNNE